MTSTWQDALAQIQDAPDAAIDALLDGEAADPEAALALALILLESEADDDAGLYWLTSAARSGAPGARRLLARALLQGRGSRRPDAREAVRLLLRAARDGEDGALDDLVQLTLLLDDALLLDAALGMQGDPAAFRQSFLRAVREGAPAWFARFGDQLEEALALGG